MRRTTLRAFTLIELLVVVAILALLISILLPSLNRARAQARLVKCSTQLREFARACAMYVDDHDDTMPPHKSEDQGSKADWQKTEGSRYNVFTLMEPYLGRKSAAQALNGDESDRNEREHQLAMCPEVLVKDDLEWEYNEDNIGYGYNAYWLGIYNWNNVHSDAEAKAATDYCFPNAYSRRALAQSTDVKNGAECILFGDSFPAGAARGDYLRYSSTLFYPFIASMNEGVWTRHMKRKNDQGYRYRNNTMHPNSATLYPDGKGATAFVDGHVDALRSDQINRIVDARRYWDPWRGIGGLKKADEVEIPYSSGRGNRPPQDDDQ